MKWNLLEELRELPPEEQDIAIEEMLRAIEIIFCDRRGLLGKDHEDVSPHLPKHPQQFFSFWPMN